MLKTKNPHVPPVRGGLAQQHAARSASMTTRPGATNPRRLLFVLARYNFRPPIKLRPAIAASLKSAAAERLSPPAW